MMNGSLEKTLEGVMKKTFIFVLMVCFVFSANPGWAQFPAGLDRNLIFTEGTAEEAGQNDSAKISIAVVTQGRKLEPVSTENASKTHSVIAAVKGLNIKNLKMQTSNYRVTPQKDYKARPPKINGYEIHNAIEVTMEGFEPEQLSNHVSRVVEKALESGSNHIGHIQFYIQNKSELEKKALARATLEAVERAKTLAEAAGVKLERIAMLSTQPVYTPPRAQMLRAAEMGADAGVEAPPMEIGESRIQVRVNIAYEIAP